MCVACLGVPIPGRDTGMGVPTDGGAESSPSIISLASEVGRAAGSAGENCSISLLSSGNASVGFR